MNKNSIIKQLDNITKKCAYEHFLFDGGCAYASAIIAKKLDLAHIDYDVIIHSKYGKSAIKKNKSCGHVAIRTKINNKPIYIGGQCSPGDYEIYNLGKISPNVLMNYYQTVRKNDEWNTCYNVKFNSTFSRMCNSVL